MNLKHPITLSMIGLVLITVISALVFWLWKPDFVLETGEKKKINWGKLISLSTVLGVVIAIVLFLTTMKSGTQSQELMTNKEQAAMRFSHCY